jgi:hypothetical protein
MLSLTDPRWRSLQGGYGYSAAWSDLETLALRDLAGASDRELIGGSADRRRAGAESAETWGPFVLTRS